MRKFFSADLPLSDTPFDQVEYVALDLETTGLSAKEHEILSIGWVVLQGDRVKLDSCGHELIKPKEELKGESVTIHKIFDSHLEDAGTLKAALNKVMPVLAGRVLIAHHARVEHTFLKTACLQCFNTPFAMPTIDTMEIERSIFARNNKEAGYGQYRLDAVRKRYNLPRYRAHNAMIDAISAGELFLAQAQHRSGDNPLPLKAFLR
ncbi:MAG: exonuclease domain-containing protein [Alphaproteobacteria bacterium]|nr:exonuclease domain-containing protein [Rhodospirillales bacterium]MCW9045382.1 exonuclease domain-containing protein [Alphaproteobacteria bacterium]